MRALAVLLFLCAPGCEEPPASPASPSPPPPVSAPPLGAAELCERLGTPPRDRGACEIALERIEAQASPALWARFSACVQEHAGAKDVSDRCLTDEVKRFILQDLKHGHDHDDELR